MTTGSDYQLGQRIAALFVAQRTSELPPGAIVSQVQDLLGAETSLLGPLRDLLLRPAYRQLSDQSRGGVASASQLLAGRDALLQDLALTYHPSVVARLASLIDGSLALPPGASPLPATAAAAIPEPPHPFVAAAGGPLPSQAPPSRSPSAWGAVPAAPVAPAGVPMSSPPPAPVQVVASGPGAVTALLIALVSLLSGAVLLALGWLLLSGRPQVAGGGTPATPTAPAPAPSPPAAPAPPPTPKGAAPTPPASPSPGVWGGASEYKFGQLPGGSYPNSCAFSVTDANGRTTTDKSRIEYWACRDVGGDPDSGYRVVWADGKETTYTFAADGNGTVVGTNGSSYPMRWRNDSHQGSDIVVIDHQDGAISWIPGHIRGSQE